MAVIACYRERDARRLGALIESHYERMQEWPDFTDLTFVANPLRDQTLNLIAINNWTNLDSLRVFCAEHYFDLLTIRTLSDNFHINGDVLTLSIPDEMYAPYLEKMLTQE